MKLNTYRFKKIKKIILILSVAVILSAAYLTVFSIDVYAKPEDQTASEQDQIVEIRTVDELVNAAKQETGSFKLMCDLDMTGIDWKPWDFSGTFDGNGYSILNVSIKSCGEKTLKTYDGNRKEYDTYGAGFFGVVNQATIKNLSLYGIKVLVATDKHAFAAPIAGVAEAANISDCVIENAYISLTSSANMWGCGGIAGYGSGAINKVNTDATLICIDTDKVTKDEQFLGGAYAAGYLDITNCNININGYDSDHGYVHNGGLVGMYIVYPVSNVSTYKGQIINNRVVGQITFFEDNPDRRAYCKDSVGEVMNWTYSYAQFTSDFKSNEVKDYSKDLMPEMCESPSYTDMVTAPTDKEYGFTTHTCKTCGYSYVDAYVIHEHKADMKVIESDKEGLTTTELLSGVCSLCNKNVYESKVTVETPTEEENVTNETVEGNKLSGTRIIIVILLAIGAVLLIIFILLVIKIIKENKSIKKKKRKKRV